MKVLGTKPIDTGALKALRERYGHECRVCGATLQLQDTRDMTYACTGQEDDPEHPGYLRYKEGRKCVDEH